MDVIDRAVHNSPPPLDDVGGCEETDFDEKDPTRKWTFDVIRARLREIRRNPPIALSDIILRKSGAK